MSRPAKPVEVSVVIPAHNEEQFVAACIRSLKNQSFDRPYEIIVVDNDSSDRTFEAASTSGVQVLFEPHRGITWARQRGLDAARGGIIAFVDADTEVAPDWLEQICAALKDGPEIVAVSGKVLYKKSGQWRGRLPAYWVGLVRLADIAFRFLVGKPGSLWGGHFAVRKEALKKAGGFNKNIRFFGEDTELSLRLRRVGKIHYNKKQLVYTSPRRFESQPLLKTAWYYLSNFVWLMVFNRSLEGRSKRPAGPLGLFFKRALYLFSILFVPVALTVFAFNPASQFYGKVYSAGFGQKEKTIALTFDDGPDEPYTSEVLKILADNKIKATFFVIGSNAEYYPDAAKKITQAGHIIANHSYHHSYLLPFENNAQIKEEVERTEQLLYRLTGLRTALFRPPHGLRTPWFLKDVRALNYSVITWSDMTDDYDPGDPPQEIYQDIMKKAGPGGIIDLHDGRDLVHGINRGNTVQALPMIISRLKKEGYTFVTLPQLLHLKAYK